MQNAHFYTHLNSLGLIRITGPDAEKFLQGQLTCDVREVRSLQSRLGAHCDHKGRIQATFRLFADAEHYYLQLPRSVVSHLMQSLQKYAVFSKVTLMDVSQEWQQIGVCGDINLDLSLPSKTDEIIIADDFFILNIPGTTTRFCLLNSTKSLTNILNALPEQPESVWQLMDIDAGIPTIFPETIGLFTPQQINFPAINGISFTKGCYTGQEIVARMHYLGKSKQRMYRVSFSSAHLPSPGAALFTAQQEVGQLVQAAFISNEKCQGLAVIYDSAINESIHVNNVTGAILNILDLPYTDKLNN